MDKLGRRPLLLVPMVLMVLILALITIALKLQVNLAYITDLVLSGHVLHVGSRHYPFLWSVHCKLLFSIQLSFMLLHVLQIQCSIFPSKLE